MMCSALACRSTTTSDGAVDGVSVHTEIYKDGFWSVGCKGDGAMYVFQDGEPFKKVQHHKGSIFSISRMHDSSMMCSGGKDGHERYGEQHRG